VGCYDLKNRRFIHYTSNGQTWAFTYEDGPEYDPIPYPQAGPEKQVENVVLHGMIKAYPNPLNSCININIDCRFKIEDLRLKIYDINGKMVNDLTSKIKNQQSSILNQITWNASHLTPGIYLVKLYTNQRIYTKRITLLK
jgi:hypothetical protein